MKLTTCFLSVLSALCFAGAADAANLNIVVTPGVHFTKNIPIYADATFALTAGDDWTSSGFLNKSLSSAAIAGIAPITDLEQYNSQFHGGGLFSLAKISLDITDSTTGATYYHCDVTPEIPDTGFTKDASYYFVIEKNNQCRWVVTP